MDFDVPADKKGHVQSCCRGRESLGFGEIEDMGSHLNKRRRTPGPHHRACVRLSSLSQAAKDRARDAQEGFEERLGPGCRGKSRGCARDLEGTRDERWVVSSSTEDSGGGGGQRKELWRQEKGHAEGASKREREREQSFTSVTRRGTKERDGKTSRNEKSKRKTRLVYSASRATVAADTFLALEKKFVRYEKVFYETS